MVRKKYRALRVVAFLLQVLAWITLVLTLLAMIGVIGAGALDMVRIPALDALRGPTIVPGSGLVAGIISAVGILIAGLVNFVVLLGLSDLLYVLIDNETNTRQSAEYLRQVVALQQSAMAPSAPAPAVVTPTMAIAPLPPEAFAPTPTVTTQTPPAEQS